MKGFAPLQREFFAPDQYWTSKPFTRQMAFLDLLILAGFKERIVSIAGHEITLKTGELAFSERFLARRWNRSRRFVEDAFEEFSSKGMIEIEARKYITVIRITDFGKYHHLPEKPSPEEPGNKAPEKPDKEPPSGEHKHDETGPNSKDFPLSNSGSTHEGSRERSRPNPAKRSQIEECSYDYKKKENTPPPEASFLSEFLYSEIMKNDPYFKKPPGADWPAEMGRLMSEKGIPPSELYRMIEVSQKKPFWTQHITSPSGIRRHFHSLFIEMKEEERKTNQQKLLPASQRPSNEIRSEY